MKEESAKELHSGVAATPQTTDCKTNFFKDDKNRLHGNLELNNPTAIDTKLLQAAIEDGLLTCSKDENKKEYRITLDYSSADLQQIGSMGALLKTLADTTAEGQSQRLQRLKPLLQCLTAHLLRASINEDKEAPPMGSFSRDPGTTLNDELTITDTNEHPFKGAMPEVADCEDSNDSGLPVEQVIANHMYASELVQALTSITHSNPVNIIRRRSETDNLSDRTPQQMDAGSAVIKVGNTLLNVNVGYLSSELRNSPIDLQVSLRENENDPPTRMTITLTPYADGNNPATLGDGLEAVKYNSAKPLSPSCLQQPITAGENSFPECTPVKKLWPTRSGGASPPLVSNRPPLKSIQTLDSLEQKDNANIRHLAGPVASNRCLQESDKIHYSAGGAHVAKCLGPLCSDGVNFATSPSAIPSIPEAQNWPSTSPILLSQQATPQLVYQKGCTNPPHASPSCKLALLSGVTDVGLVSQANIVERGGTSPQYDPKRSTKSASGSHKESCLRPISRTCPDDVPSIPVAQNWENPSPTLLSQQVNPLSCAADRKTALSVKAALLSGIKDKKLHTRQELAQEKQEYSSSEDAKIHYSAGGSHPAKCLGHLSTEQAPASEIPCIPEAQNWPPASPVLLSQQATPEMVQHAECANAKKTATRIKPALLAGVRDKGLWTPAELAELEKLTLETDSTPKECHSESRIHYSAGGSHVERCLGPMCPERESQRTSPCAVPAISRAQNWEDPSPLLLDQQTSPRTLQLRQCTDQIQTASSNKPALVSGIMSEGLLTRGELAQIHKSPERGARSFIPKLYRSPKVSGSCKGMNNNEETAAPYNLSPKWPPESPVVKSQHASPRAIDQPPLKDEDSKDAVLEGNRNEQLQQHNFGANSEECINACSNEERVHCAASGVHPERCVGPICIDGFFNQSDPREIPTIPAAQNWTRTPPVLLSQQTTPKTLEMVGCSDRIKSPGSGKPATISGVKHVPVVRRAELEKMDKRLARIDIDERIHHSVGGTHAGKCIGSLCYGGRSPPSGVGCTFPECVPTTPMAQNWTDISPVLLSQQTSPQSIVQKKCTNDVQAAASGKVSIFSGVHDIGLIRRSDFGSGQKGSDKLGSVSRTHHSAGGSHQGRCLGPICTEGRVSSPSGVGCVSPCLVPTIPRAQNWEDVSPLLLSQQTSPALISQKGCSNAVRTAMNWKRALLSGAHDKPFVKQEELVRESRSSKLTDSATRIHHSVGGSHPCACVGSLCGATQSGVGCVDPGCVPTVPMAQNWPETSPILLSQQASPQIIDEKGCPQLPHSPSSCKPALVSGVKDKGLVSRAELVSEKLCFGPYSAHTKTHHSAAGSHKGSCIASLCLETGNPTQSGMGCANPCDVPTAPSAQNWEATSPLLLSQQASPKILREKTCPGEPVSPSSWKPALLSGMWNEAVASRKAAAEAEQVCIDSRERYHNSAGGSHAEDHIGSLCPDECATQSGPGCVSPRDVPSVPEAQNWTSVPPILLGQQATPQFRENTLCNETPTSPFSAKPALFSGSHDVNAISQGVEEDCLFNPTPNTLIASGKSTPGLCEGNKNFLSSSTYSGGYSGVANGTKPQQQLVSEENAKSYSSIAENPKNAAVVVGSNGLLPQMDCSKSFSTPLEAKEETSCSQPKVAQNDDGEATPQPLSECEEECPDSQDYPLQPPSLKLPPPGTEHVAKVAEMSNHTEEFAEQIVSHALDAAIENIQTETYADDGIVGPATAHQPVLHHATSDIATSCRGQEGSVAVEVNSQNETRRVCLGTASASDYTLKLCQGASEDAMKVNVKVSLSGNTSRPGDSSVYQAESSRLLPSETSSNLLSYPVTTPTPTPPCPPDFTPLEPSCPPPMLPDISQSPTDGMMMPANYHQMLFNCPSGLMPEFLPQAPTTMQGSPVPSGMFSPQQMVQGMSEGLPFAPQIGMMQRSGLPHAPTCPCPTAAAALLAMGGGQWPGISQHAGAFMVPGMPMMMPGVNYESPLVPPCSPCPQESLPPATTSPSSIGACSENAQTSVNQVECQPNNPIGNEAEVEEVEDCLPELETNREEPNESAATNESSSIGPSDHVPDVCACRKETKTLADGSELACGSCECVPELPAPFNGEDQKGEVRVKFSFCKGSAPEEVGAERHRSQQDGAVGSVGINLSESDQSAPPSSTSSKCQSSKEHKNRNCINRDSFENLKTEDQMISPNNTNDPNFRNAGAPYYKENTKSGGNHAGPASPGAFSKSPQPQNLCRPGSPSGFGQMPQGYIANPVVSQQGNMHQQVRPGGAEGNVVGQGQEMNAQAAAFLMMCMQQGIHPAEYHQMMAQQQAAAYFQRAMSPQQCQQNAQLQNMYAQQNLQKQQQQQQPRDDCQKMKYLQSPQQQQQLQPQAANPHYASPPPISPATVVPSKPQTPTAIPGPSSPAPKENRKTSLNTPSPVRRRTSSTSGAPKTIDAVKVCAKMSNSGGKVMGSRPASPCANISPKLPVQTNPKGPNSPISQKASPFFVAGARGSGNSPGTNDKRTSTLGAAKKTAPSPKARCPQTPQQTGRLASPVPSELPNSQSPPPAEQQQNPRPGVGVTRTQQSSTRIGGIGCDKSAIDLDVKLTISSVGELSQRTDSGVGGAEIEKLRNALEDSGNVGEDDNPCCPDVPCSCVYNDEYDDGPCSECVREGTVLERCAEKAAELPQSTLTHDRDASARSAAQSPKTNPPEKPVGVVRTPRENSCNEADGVKEAASNGPRSCEDTAPSKTRNLSVSGQEMVCQQCPCVMDENGLQHCECCADENAEQISISINIDNSGKAEIANCIKKRDSLPKDNNALPTPVSQVSSSRQSDQGSKFPCGNRGRKHSSGGNSPFQKSQESPVATPSPLPSNGEGQQDAASLENCGQICTTCCGTGYIVTPATSPDMTLGQQKSLCPPRGAHLTTPMLQVCRPPSAVNLMPESATTSIEEAYSGGRAYERTPSPDARVLDGVCAPDGADTSNFRRSLMLNTPNGTLHFDCGIDFNLLDSPKPTGRALFDVCFFLDSSQSEQCCQGPQNDTCNQSGQNSCSDGRHSHQKRPLSPCGGPGENNNCVPVTKYTSILWNPLDGALALRSNFRNCTKNTTYYLNKNDNNVGQVQENRQLAPTDKGIIHLIPNRVSLSSTPFRVPYHDIIEAYSRPTNAVLLPPFTILGSGRNLLDVIYRTCRSLLCFVKSNLTRRLSFSDEGLGSTEKSANNARTTTLHGKAFGEMAYSRLTLSQASELLGRRLHTQVHRHGQKQGMLEPQRFSASLKKTPLQALTNLQGILGSGESAPRRPRLFRMSTESFPDPSSATRFSNAPSDPQRAKDVPPYSNLFLLVDTKSREPSDSCTTITSKTPNYRTMTTSEFESSLIQRVEEITSPEHEEGLSQVGTDRHDHPSGVSTNSDETYLPTLIPVALHTGQEAVSLLFEENMGISGGYRLDDMGQTTPPGDYESQPNLTECYVDTFSEFHQSEQQTVTLPTPKSRRRKCAMGSCCNQETQNQSQQPEPKREKQLSSGETLRRAGASVLCEY